MSDEIVSGVAAAGNRHFGNRKSQNCRRPWPTSKITPRWLGGERRRQQLAVLHDVGEGAGDVRRAGNNNGSARRPAAADRGSATISSLVSTPTDMHHHLGRPAAHISQAWIARFERLQNRA